MESKRTRKPKRLGRPPRTDRPAQVHVRIAGALRSWMREQAAQEDVYEGDLLARLLIEYRERLRRRRKP